jgi:hypothetical protein
LLRWWDGSTWTQHTHAGNAQDPSDASGPPTSLDATRIGTVRGAAGDEAPRTTIERLVAQPTTVQPAAVQPLALHPTMVQPTTVQPTTVQPPVPALRPGPSLDRTQVQASVSHPGVRQPGTGSPWPDAGPAAGYRETEPPYGAGEAGHFGTQVLPIGEADWTAPGGYPGRASRHGYEPDERRRRMLLGGLLAGGTVVALALIAIVVNTLNSSGPSAPPAGLPATTSAPASPASPSAQATTPTPTQTPSGSATAGGLSDSSSGLSYALLAAPWTSGCPGNLSNQQTISWTAGESAQAGQFTYNNNPTTWYGEACSAPLPQQYGYTGVADLGPTAMNLVNQFDGPYYGALNHQATQLSSSPLQISGHPAWEVKYQETYPDAASQGAPFTSEEAAVLVVDQGTGLSPAVFFVSVPSNLGVTNVDALVGSLTLTVTAPTQSPTPDQGGQPGNGNGHGGGHGGP